jgi:Protein of unknown function (DUF3307)
VTGELVLYLLAAHLVGDFLLQTRWQAVGKFGWTPEAIWLRGKHVFVYGACFVIALVPAADHLGNLAFLASLMLLHFLTDSRRFTSTVGDWIAWNLMWAPREPSGYRPDPRVRPLPPNPWPSLPLAIDQTLHIVQIAVLAGLFL